MQTLLNTCVTSDHGYVPLAVNTFRSFPHSRLITRFSTRVIRRVPVVQQELHTLPEHLRSTPLFTGFVLQYTIFISLFPPFFLPDLLLYVQCFVNHCLSFCLFFFFGHCAVCPFSIYGFRLHLWYLQTLLTFIKDMKIELLKRSN